MTTTRQFLFATLTGCLVLLLVSIPNARAQAAPPAGVKLPLNAVLVLTPEFCATKFKQGSFWTTGRETFEVGKIACKELEPALKPVFANLTVASAIPAPGAAQIVLIPKFANAHATTGVFVFSQREMDVLLEWTVQDAAGKTVWLQTVQGKSRHAIGNYATLTYFHQAKVLVTDSVKDAATQSVAKIEAAPELLKLVPEYTSSAK